VAFVLDASIALAWCFAEEGTPYTRAVLRDVQRVEAFAPAVWQLEVCNALLIGERRGRLTEAKSKDLIRVLLELPISIDIESASNGLALADLARKHTLSSYDASYLELASRRRLPVATNDKRLRAAARREGISLARPA
jgi:predicted nucleic acid-binding protein